jgi:hypothetical protein
LEVPRDETLSIIREVLLIVLLANIVRNLIVHYAVLFGRASQDLFEYQLYQPGHNDLKSVLVRNGSEDIPALLASRDFTMLGVAA